MSQLKNDQPKCGCVGKHGLPILLTRYAVAPEAALAPVSSGTFHVGDVDGSAIKLGGAVNYTQRILRSGYVYVFDEKRSKWQGYFVNEGGYFSPFTINANGPQVVVAPVNAMPCGYEGHREVASCITVSSPKDAGIVWIVFSDVEWTYDVWKKHHDDKAYRKLHMREFDVGKWMASTSHRHAVGMHLIAKNVTEYSPKTVAKEFSFSVARLQPRQKFTQSLIKASENLLCGKGVVLALDDPAGIAMDLGALMRARFDAFVGSKEWAHQLATSNAIIQIEEAVRAQALAEEEAAAERLANETAANAGLAMLFDGYRKSVESIRTVTPAEAKQVQDNTWKKYTKKFNEKSAREWRSKFDEQLRKYDEGYISPLALAHSSWMQSKILCNRFTCTHDKANPESGIVYSKTLGLCILGTQDKAACFDLYVKWLSADVIEKENLLLNALCLNLEKTKQDIQNAMKVSLDWRSYPLDGVVGGFAGATESVFKLEADAVGKYLVAPILGCLSKVMANAVDGKVKPALVAMGLYTGKTFTVVEVVGSKKAFRAQLIRELIRGSGQTVQPRQMEKAVAAELRRLEVAGVSLAGTEKKRFLLMVDSQKLKVMPSGLKSQDQAKWLASHITSQEKLEALDLSSWRQEIRGGGAEIKVGNTARGRIAASIPFIGGMIAAVIQYNAIQKMGEDKDKSMSHEAKESYRRYQAGCAAFAGTIAEMTGWLQESWLHRFQN